MISCASVVTSLSIGVSGNPGLRHISMSRMSSSSEGGKFITNRSDTRNFQNIFPKMGNFFHFLVLIWASGGRASN